MARLTRIEALLGVAKLDEADEDAIDALVSGAVREATDLDFKQSLYGNGDSERRELAGDVAALANAEGGVLVLGIDEVDGAASAKRPVALSDAEELRMRQILASNVGPFVPVEIHRVASDTDPASGFYLIEVPRSVSAPHAVVVGTGLRYPRRDGTTTRWLSESEVADAYRDRFSLARDQVARIEEVRRDGEGRLPAPDGHAWMVLALAPNQRGHMPVTNSSVDGLRELPRQTSIPFLGHQSVLHSTHAIARAGHRRVELSIGEFDDGRPGYGTVDLHEDGAGFVALMVGRKADRDPDPPRLWINDEWLTREVVAALAVAAAYASSVSGGGDAAVEATLISSEPMDLHSGRGFGSDTWNRHPIESVPIGRRTVSLGDISASATGLLAAARLVLSDIVQGFGIAESPQILAGGALRLAGFRRDIQRQIEAGAEKAGIDVAG